MLRPGEIHNRSEVVCPLFGSSSPLGSWPRRETSPLKASASPPEPGGTQPRTGESRPLPVPAPSAARPLPQKSDPTHPLPQPSAKSSEKTLRAPRSSGFSHSLSTSKASPPGENPPVNGRPGGLPKPCQRVATKRRLVKGRSRRENLHGPRPVPVPEGWSPDWLKSAPPASAPGGRSPAPRSQGRLRCPLGEKPSESRSELPLGAYLDAAPARSPGVWPGAPPGVAAKGGRQRRGKAAPSPAKAQRLRLRLGRDLPSRRSSAVRRGGAQARRCFFCECKERSAARL